MWSRWPWQPSPSPIRLLAAHARAYLPADILVKVDRAAMAVGLETRAPFLDHRVAAVAWLRGPLRPWAEDLLDPALLRRQGYLQPEPVQRLWRAQLRGADHTPQLWTVLMWQAWLAEWHP